MIVTVTLNPAFDKVLTLAQCQLGTLNRVQLGPHTPSGKGINVARVVQSWGYPVTALALAGEGSDRLDAFLTARNVPHRLVPVPGAMRTNIKLMEKTSGRMTEINEPGPTVNAESLAMLEEELVRLCRTAEVVVFSGSLPPGVPSDYYRRLVQIVDGLGVAAVVDSSGDSMRQAVQMPLLAMKPNRREAEDLVGRRGLGDTELMCELERLGATHTLLSMGASGALFAYHGQRIRAIPPPIKAGIASGAGDAMLATYLVGVLQQWPFEQIAVRATAAGTAAVRGLGNELTTPQDVADLVDSVRIEPA